MHIELYCAGNIHNQFCAIDYNYENYFSEQIIDLLKSYFCGRTKNSQIPEYHHRMLAALGKGHTKWSTLDETYMMARVRSFQDSCAESQDSNAMLLIISVFVLLQMGTCYMILS